MNPDWIDQARRLFDGLRSGTGDAPAHGSDCRWCPVCQAAAVLRGERPEVTAALADVLTATATALRAFAAAGEPRSEPPTEATDGPQPEDAPAVQRIDIA
jgi:hypothetical protein